MDDKPSLKWAWSRHVIKFKLQGRSHISGMSEARIIKFLTQVAYIKCYQKDVMSSAYDHVILPFAVMQRVEWDRSSMTADGLVFCGNYVSILCLSKIKQVIC